MARWESRMLWGALLILAGLAFLLQNLGILPMGDLFWALLFGLGGVAFLSVFVTNRENWWGLIPGLTLLGIGLLIALGTLAPGFADQWGGSIVLGAIGLSFIIIYLIRRDFWWAIIPGGILLTLAILVSLEAVVGGFNMGGLFLLGIGLTFAIVAVTPTAEGRMVWAWIPAGILSLLGLLVLAETESLIGYIWPVVLILLGLVLIYRTFIHRR
jgi:hypothetical protein